MGKRSTEKINEFFHALVGLALLTVLVALILLVGWLLPGEMVGAPEGSGLVDTLLRGALWLLALTMALALAAMAFAAFSCIWTGLTMLGEFVISLFKRHPA